MIDVDTKVAEIINQMFKDIYTGTDQQTFEKNRYVGFSVVIEKPTMASDGFRKC